MPPEWSLKPYTPDWAGQWDNLVCEAPNGTLFHTRRFLSYHPDGRFHEASVLVFDKETLVAVLALAQTTEGLWSHPGTTGGGPVIAQQYWSAQTLLSLLEWLDQQLGLYSLRLPEPFLSDEAIDILHWHFGQKRHTRRELSAVKWLQAHDALMDVRRPRTRQQVRALRQKGYQLRECTSAEHTDKWYTMLCRNLSHHNAAPVHSLEELLRLRALLGPQQRLLGYFDTDENLVAGLWIIEAKPGRWHCQYIARDAERAPSGAMEACQVEAMNTLASEGASLLSLGISTEHRGQDINLGLIAFKQNLGCTLVNRHLYTRPGAL